MPGVARSRRSVRAPPRLSGSLRRGAPGPAPPVAPPAPLRAPPAAPAASPETLRSTGARRRSRSLATPPRPGALAASRLPVPSAPARVDPRPAGRRPAGPRASVRPLGAPVGPRPAPRCARGALVLFPDPFEAPFSPRPALVARVRASGPRPPPRPGRAASGAPSSSFSSRPRAISASDSIRPRALRELRGMLANLTPPSCTPAGSAPATANGGALRLPRLTRSGGVLLSQGHSSQVPSALEGLTSVFGMGTGVTPPPWPPKDQLSRRNAAVAQVLHSEHELRCNPKTQALGRLVPVS